MIGIIFITSRPATYKPSDEHQEQEKHVQAQLKRAEGFGYFFVGGEGEKMGLLVGARDEKTLCSVCFLSVSKMRKQFQTASHKTWVETRLVMGHYDCAAG